MTIDGKRLKYQEGPLSTMRNPSDLMSRAGGAAKFATGTIMFCGTLGAIGGIRPAAQFTAVLEDPILGREMSCEYNIDVIAGCPLMTGQRDCEFWDKEFQFFRCGKNPPLFSCYLKCQNCCSELQSG